MSEELHVRPVAADGERRSPRFDRIDVAVGTTLAIVGAALFAFTHPRLVEPVIDLGRDLYIPTAILDGRKLYRDILYYYPPLAAYLVAGWMAVFGRSLDAVAALGATLAAICATSIYVATRIWGGRAAAASAVALFLGWSLAGVSTWGCNFIFPYAHAATIGMTATMVALASFAWHFSGTRSAASGTVATIALLFAAWSKLEFTLLAVAMIVAGAAIYRFRARYVISFALAGLVSFSAAAFFFADAGEGHHWLHDNILPESLLSSPIAARFYASVSGVDAWPALLAGSVTGGGLIVAIVLLLRGIEAAAGSRRHWLVGVLVVAIAAIQVALLRDQLFFRAWTILQLLLIPLAVRQRGRTPLALLLAVTLLATWRVGLRIAPVWYGFVLTIPLFVLAAAVLFQTLVELRAYSRRLALLWLPLLIGSSIDGAVQSVRETRRREHRVETVRGHYYDASSSRARAVNELVTELRRRRATGLVVIPEGLTLNYFTGVPTPLTVQTFTPIEAAFPEIEQLIVHELQTRRPEYVAIVTRDLSEFGYRGWGVDYNREAAGFVREHYRVVRGWLHDDFRLLLLRRM